MKRTIGDRSCRKLCAATGGEGDAVWRETLYQKCTGEYFLHGAGGPSAGQGAWSGGEKIVPLSAAQARAWAMGRLGADAFGIVFGGASLDGKVPRGETPARDE